MANPHYVPDRGDLAGVDLNPQKGHKQAGRRPALILSPESYNRKTGLCILCPSTRQAKGYAFEVENPSEEVSQSILLADHIRCVDWIYSLRMKIHLSPSPPNPLGSRPLPIGGEGRGEGVFSPVTSITRRMEFIRRVPGEVLQEVVAKLEAPIIHPDQ